VLFVLMPGKKLKFVCVGLNLDTVQSHVQFFRGMVPLKSLGTVKSVTLPQRFLISLCVYRNGPKIQRIHEKYLVVVGEYVVYRTSMIV
jgi:hypothetical protein